MSVEAVPSIRPGSAADIAAVRLLLGMARLPTADLEIARGLRYWVLEAGEEVIGVIGLEWFGGTAALVRSLTVAPGCRRQGSGQELLSTLEAQAGALGVRQLVLLTTTAQAFFAARGYNVIERSSVPETLKQSEEFRSLCPAAAVCMAKTLVSCNG